MKLINNEKMIHEKILVQSRNNEAKETSFAPNAIKLGCAMF